MCFSPEVSFGAAAVLIPTGIYCVRVAARRCPRLWPFAVVPCLFGIQQAVEGVAWVGLQTGDQLTTVSAARLYLFFALAFWPVWFPLAAAISEPPNRLRKWLWAWTVVSTSWAAAYLPVLSTGEGGNASICHYSIRYQYADSTLLLNTAWAMRGLYLFTAATPLLLCSARRVLVLPVVLGTGSAVWAAVVYDHAYTSVWCLFSAVLSASILWTVHRAGSMYAVIHRPLVEGVS